MNIPSLSGYKNESITLSYRALQWNHPGVTYPLTASLESRRLLPGAHTPGAVNQRENAQTYRLHDLGQVIVPLSLQPRSNNGDTRTCLYLTRHAVAQERARSPPPLRCHGQGSQLWLMGCDSTEGSKSTSAPLLAQAWSTRAAVASPPGEKAVPHSAEK